MALEGDRAHKSPKKKYFLNSFLGGDFWAVQIRLDQGLFSSRKCICKGAYQKKARERLFLRVYLEAINVSITVFFKKKGGNLFFWGLLSGQKYCVFADKNEDFIRVYLGDRKFCIIGSR